MSGARYAGSPPIPVFSFRETEGTRKGMEKAFGAGPVESWFCSCGAPIPSAGQALARRRDCPLPGPHSPERGNETRSGRGGGRGRRCGARGGPRGGAAGLSPPPAPGPVASPARSQPPCASCWPHRRTMKALLLAVLAAVLCVERGKAGEGEMPPATITSSRGLLVLP